jgi:hypothetical protein
VREVSALVDQIARAIGDPGAVVGRRLHPSWGEGNDGYAEEAESITRWSTRAVMQVLADAGPKDAATRVLSWDHREQPDLAALGTALRDLSDARLYEVDTGSDQYAIVLATGDLTDDEAQAAYTEWYEGEDGHG